MHSEPRLGLIFFAICQIVLDFISCDENHNLVAGDPIYLREAFTKKPTFQVRRRQTHLLPIYVQALTSNMKQFFFIFKLAGDPIYLRDPWPLIRPHYLTDSHVKYADIYMIVSSLLFFQGVDGNYEGNNGLPGVTGPPGPQVHNQLHVRTLTFLLQQIF